MLPTLLAHAGAHAGSFLSSWTLDPWQLVPTAAVSIAYARRATTLARRGTPVPTWRQWIFWLGIALVLAALVSPIDVWGEEEFFFVHMGQHVLLGDLAPLCFVVGLTGPVLRPILQFHAVDRLRILTHPFVALPLWAVNLYVWHVPFLYQAALHHPVVHALEHLLFFTCGALMWAPVLETLPQPEWFGTGAKLGYVAVVRVTETILGNIFIWSNSVFYPFYVHPTERWGISPAHDQNLAGVVMMIEGSFVTLITLALLFIKLAKEGELRQELLERGLDPRVVKRAVRYGRGEELLGGAP
jgi:putative membrane protein